jgi:hypothetical protein
MLGRITKYRADIGVGIIEAETGNKFRFARSAVLNGGRDLVGQEVDFLVSARKPASIILTSGSPWTVFAGRPI